MRAIDAYLMQPPVEECFIDKRTYKSKGVTGCHIFEILHVKRIQVLEDLNQRKKSVAITNLAAIKMSRKEHTVLT